MSKQHEEKNQVEKRNLGSPYGPQYGQIDDAAGGADSSPMDNLDSEERQEALRGDESKRQTLNPGP